MRIVKTVLLIQVVMVVGFFGILAFSSAIGNGTALILALSVFFAGVVALNFVRCPTCGKQVLERERGPFRYYGPFPEFTCSRCGRKLMESGPADTSTKNDPDRHF